MHPQRGRRDCATIDAVLRDAGGFRMGPFELMDMIGHDVNFAVTRSVWNAFLQRPRFPALADPAGTGGRRLLRAQVGPWLYDYREGASTPSPQAVVARTADEIVLHGHSAAVEAPPTACFEHNVAHTWGEAADGGSPRWAAPVVSHRRPHRHATRRRSGIANVVLDRPGARLHQGHPLAVGVADNCFAPAVGAPPSACCRPPASRSRLGDVRRDWR